MSGFVYAIATMDTKAIELKYVTDCLRAAGVQVRMVDVGASEQKRFIPDVTREQVRAGKPERPSESRAEAIAAMADFLKSYLLNRAADGHVAGVIGIGGSGGTSLITPAMRALDIGIPKIMVSTVASGNTAPYVDCSDITMMHSVVDVAGLNVVSRKILGNAAHAMAGMVRHQVETFSNASTVGLTMFGVTTPCVDAVRGQLEASGHQCLVFHATGTGGRAMESLVESNMLTGVLDLTTTEVADEVVGGIFPAGRDRFERSLEKEVPLVLSLGAVDMVNFGGRDTVPDRFSDRLFHVHNAEVTLMRTNAVENRGIANWIAGKLRGAKTPVEILIPEKGLSALDAPGQPFYDPDTNAVLFQTLEEQLRDCHACRIHRVPQHINDPEFADAVVKSYTRLATSAGGHRSELEPGRRKG